MQHAVLICICLTAVDKLIWTTGNELAWHKVKKDYTDVYCDWIKKIIEIFLS